MKIVLCGGGSGGHITPLLAVARELRSAQKDVILIYLGERNGKFSHIAEDSGLFDECHYISAGKLRRYHNEPLIRKLTDIKTIAFNTRDGLRLLKGTLQSIQLFKTLQPDSILLKGGYVCVPVSIGASRTGAFIVTHDSDALPGLSNRFAARYADVHATAMPAEYYSYPKSKIVHVGLPVDERFRKYSTPETRFLKEKLKIPDSAKVILVTGGSNGAKRLNYWALQAIDELMAQAKDLHAILVVGKGNTSQIKSYSFKTPSARERIHVEEFTSELFHLAAISDVIITRAGATTIAEFAMMGKACIVVPNPDLTGGHQIKNSKVYEDISGAVVIQESELKKSVKPLIGAASELINNPKLREQLSNKLKLSLPKEPAAKRLAQILLDRSKT